MPTVEGLSCSRPSSREPVEKLIVMQLVWCLTTWRRQASCWHSRPAGGAPAARLKSCSGVHSKTSRRFKIDCFKMLLTRRSADRRRGRWGGGTGSGVFWQLDRWRDLGSSLSLAPQLEAHGGLLPANGN